MEDVKAILLYAGKYMRELAKAVNRLGVVKLTYGRVEVIYILFQNVKNIVVAEPAHGVYSVAFRKLSCIVGQLVYPHVFV